MGFSFSYLAPRPYHSLLLPRFQFLPIFFNLICPNFWTRGGGQDLKPRFYFWAVLGLCFATRPPASCKTKALPARCACNWFFQKDGRPAHCRKKIYLSGNLLIARPEAELVQEKEQFKLRQAVGLVAFWLLFADQEKVTLIICKPAPVRKSVELVRKSDKFSKKK